jgi:hypothetical protein
VAATPRERRLVIETMVGGPVSELQVLLTRATPSEACASVPDGLEPEALLTLDADLRGGAGAFEGEAALDVTRRQSQLGERRCSMC